MRRYVALLAALALVGGCTADPADTTPEKQSPGGVLRVLAGSELADLEQPILKDVEKATGITVRLTYTGTLDGVEQVSSGAAGKNFDAIWFSSNRYLELQDGANGKIGTSTKVMSSPVILGLRTAQARELGWDAKRPTWKEIADAAAAKKFTYGMTNPAASNSGFSALVGAASALSGATTALNDEQVRAVTPQLQGFFSAQVLTSGSSGWLADAFKARPDVTGLINYESVLMNLKQQGTDLTLVYPSDGVVTADYPLTVLESADQAAKDRYRRVADYLRRDDVQKKLAGPVNRRPVTASAAEPEKFPGSLVELPFPVKLATADALIDSYMNTLRRAPRTLYVLDLSGSMQGERLAKLKAAMNALTGQDNSLSGRFSKFAGREQVLLIPFSGKVKPTMRYQVPAENPATELGRIRNAVDGFQADGDTAIYDALITGYTEAATEIAKDPSRFTTIVLLTDGAKTAGRDLAAFKRHLDGLTGDVRRVPVFPVLFGESTVADMEEVARVTGGRTFDGRQESLQAVFKEIRGYQ
ncbi:VWA domain-containing protein [Virgisporangium aliadipatigenens]|uniref:VWA domain-containing protein n=1 Tax=Virgisporangium aliadipatigenens TaxID=741659 RepID=A0A8J3YIA4_9ACTN|nr:extracellular solute-binding protein [Virgisporangium aliadipatigenens]GIJ44453.1 VWA domain-containing protein [Virgisporangium aliadipatigenens]